VHWLVAMLLILFVPSTSLAGGELRCGAFSLLTSEEQRWYLRGYLSSLDMEAQELDLQGAAYQAALGRARDLVAEGKRPSSTEHPLEWLALRIEERRKLAHAGLRNQVGLQSAINSACERQPAYALIELLPSTLDRLPDVWAPFDLPEPIQRAQDRFSH